MSLPKGTYNIKSRDKAGKSIYLGRLLDEDRSMLPKSVLVLPDDIKVREWQIEDLPNGMYRIKTFHSPVIKIENMVYAVVMPSGDEVLDWVILPVENHGKHKYIIADADKTSRWVLSGVEPRSQLTLEPYNEAEDDERNVFTIVPDHSRI